MGLARSTYYDEPQGQPIGEARLVERIKEICAEWPSYGYRRVTAELCATGYYVNHKKVSDVLREHARCSRCGHKGATLQIPSWQSLDVGVSPFPRG